VSQYPWFDFDQVDFVTSDQHFSHARISELAERPFATVEEMNAELVRRWNEVVGPDDIVLHLGDLALGPIEESVGLTEHLNGRRFLVPGNHDRVSPATQSRRAIERFAPLYEAAGWSILPEVIEGTRRGYRILASHYPYSGDSHGTDRHDAPPTRRRGRSAAARSHACPRSRPPRARVPRRRRRPRLHAHPLHRHRRMDPQPAGHRDTTAGRNSGSAHRARRYRRRRNPGSDALFYTQGYNELVIVLEELLAALPPDEADG
jgi:calcineurin-like phosphoesterase family protein